MNKVTSQNFRIALLSIIFLIVSISVEAQNGWFSFDIPPLDTINTEFSPAFNQSPIGNEHFVTINTNGHFEVNGEQIRFWGTPCSKNESASLSKDQYPALIKEFKKAGVNILRFHLWDSRAFNGNLSIFGASNGTRTLDADALDRLDYLIYLMKQNGIYAFIDLLCDRKYTNSDGVYAADSTYNASKVVNFYDPKLIELQKEYAQQLLTHVNPYTGNSLVNEPTMALMDIVNEGWFLHAVRNNQIKPVSKGGLLSQYHYNMIVDLWNEFLLEKYETVESVKKAWGIAEPETEKIENGDFESGAENWAWWGPGTFTTKIVTGQAHSGINSFQVSSSAASANNYDCQLQYTIPFFSSGVTYKLRFQAKADVPQNVGYTVQINKSPWTSFGSGNFTVSGDWTEYTASFTVNKSASDDPCLYFNLGLVNGNLWIDDISIQPVSIPEQFDLVQYYDLAYAPQKNDQVEFYLHLQEEYYAEMSDYLKNDLGVKIPITGSNFLSGVPDMFIQRNCDFIDNHAYWANWSTPKPVSMIPKTEYYNPVLGLFTGNKIKGKPLTVSEFNYENPNPFAYEALFFLSAYGSFHNADLLIVHQIEYNPTWDFWSHGFNSYQQISARALQPTFSYAYRNKLISTPNQYVDISFSKQDAISNTIKANPWVKDFNPDDYPFKLAYQHGVNIDFNNSNSFNRADYPAVPSNPYTTDNNEIEWDSAGLLSINTPELCAFVGKLDQFTNKTIGNITLTNADKSAGLTLLALDSKPLNESEKMLMTIVTQMKNTGMVTNGFEVIEGGSKPRIVEATAISINLSTTLDSVKIYWINENGAKSGYSEIFRNNGAGQIPITIDTYTNPGVWFGVKGFCSDCQPLPAYTVSASVKPDKSGTITGTGDYYEDETATLTATASSDYEFTKWTQNGNTVSTDPVYSFVVNASVELQANFTAISGVSANKALNTIKVFPSPTSGIIHIDGLSDNGASTIMVYASNGRLMTLKEIKNESETTIDISNLKPGLYFVTVRGDLYNCTRKVCKTTLVDNK